MSMFRKAVKEEAKLRMAISGPSGSGKTYTALLFARAIAPNGKIALVDTEHGSASKYADQFDFDALELTNFHPNNYVKAIKAAIAEGYEVIILDSLTHAWNGPGGILSMVSQNFGKWKDVQPIEQAFIEALVSSPIHVIATMRAKTQYEVEKDERTGKPSPRKLGMGPIQRDGIEYEFDITTMMDVQNTITVEKTRCPAVRGVTVNCPDGSFMEPILAWLRGETPQRELADSGQQGSASGEAPGKVTEKTLKHLHALGTELYKDRWDEIRHRNVKRVTEGRAESSAELTEEQARKLIDGLKKLKAQQAQEAAQGNAPAQEAQREESLEDAESLAF